ncbi:MAG: pentapeptide repeat-containing protein [Ferruginibacter sp.]|nr:pentapeptide repeat-containing protein [Ferruginibacter sp.]
MLRKISQFKKQVLVLNQFTIFLLICLLITGIIAVVFVSQNFAEKDMFANPLPEKDYEVAKLRAEIRQINSDTIGSLFWLKLIALFITVGSAVGGYLIGQSKVIKERLNFEKRKDVDSAYQAIVLELSGTQHILRAAAAVKLGAILKSFPFEWSISDQRKEELIDLTKQVLAAALSIEQNSKVLKTISIALILHKPDIKSNKADVKYLDLSEAKAVDAYWAKGDFSYTDFYKADLSKTSFRDSVLNGTQFREAVLGEAVLAATICEKTSFKLADLQQADFSNAVLNSVNFEGAKMPGTKWAGARITHIFNRVDDNKKMIIANFNLADLRHADFSNAKLTKVNFEGAKMYGTKWEGAEFSEMVDAQVDISPDGDGSERVSFLAWRNLVPAK